MVATAPSHNRRSRHRRPPSGFSDLGVDPLGDTLQEFAATIARDIAVWREAVRLTGALEK